jgi:hypothetical protein
MGGKFPPPQGPKYTLGGTESAHAGTITKEGVYKRNEKAGKNRSPWGQSGKFAGVVHASGRTGALEGYKEAGEGEQ